MSIRFLMAGMLLAFSGLSVSVPVLLRRANAKKLRAVENARRLDEAVSGETPMQDDTKTKPDEAMPPGMSARKWLDQLCVCGQTRKNHSCGNFRLAPEPTDQAA